MNNFYYFTILDTETEVKKKKKKKKKNSVKNT